MISEECKAYELFARKAWQDAPFPMVKNKLMRYIKMRARSSTFPNFMSNLDKHPLHGPQWLEEMNKDSEVKKLMQLSVNLWPKQTKECQQPLIGIGYVNKRFKDNWNNLEKQDKKQLDNVRVVQGPKAKGFMVTDDQDPLLNFPVNRPITIYTTSQLSSDSLYLPSLKVRRTDRLYEDEGYDADELQVIDAKEFSGVDITDINNPYEEGSSSSMSSKKNSKEEEEEEEYDYNFDYSQLNDFDVDLGDDFTVPTELKDIDNSLNDMDVDNNMNNISDVDMSDLDMREIDYLCDIMRDGTKDNVYPPIDNTQEEDFAELVAQIKEPVVQVKALKLPRGRPRTKPIKVKLPRGRPHTKPRPLPKPTKPTKLRKATTAPKTPLSTRRLKTAPAIMKKSRGRPRKNIQEPKVLINIVEQLNGEKQVEDLKIFDFNAEEFS